MHRNRFAPDVELGSVRITMRVEPDISSVRQMRSQGAFAAADVENFIPRSNQFGNAPEFGPGDAGNAQGPVKVSAPIKVQVKGLVPRQPRIEEARPALRFPQAEMVDAIELPIRRNPKSSAPQSTDQPGADGLNAALCRKARDRAQGNGLHRLAEIAAGDNNGAGVVTRRLVGT